jgi:SAM-dependent methyltransferase
VSPPDTPAPDRSREKSDHVARQRHFYESRPHRALQPRDGDLYVDKLVGTLAAHLRIQAHHRVLEVGAGFGRFTFALLERCASVTAVDLSEQALGALEGTRDARGIGAERCRAVRADLDSLDADEIGAPFDAVIGFFILHHLEDVEASLARLVRLAAPGGAIGFIEPNSWNPLYAVQVACCPDMTWGEEKGVWRLRAHAVERCFERCGVEPQPTHRFGCFPPQVVNRLAWARQLEDRLERQRWLAGVLPFLVLSARVPTPGGQAR